jgi:hypothetical protein
MLIITISINQHHDIRRKDEQNFVTSDFCQTIEPTDRRTIDRRIINTTSIETNRANNTYRHGMCFRASSVFVVSILF